MIHETGLLAVGHDGQVVSRGDDPVPPQFAREGQVALGGEQHGNSIELMALQQLFHLAGDGFLDHCREHSLPDGQTVVPAP